LPPPSRERKGECEYETRPDLFFPFPLERGRYVEEPHDAEGEAAAQAAIAPSRALGDDDWVKQTTARLGLGHTLRPNGRPRSAREVS
jgi:hypothetical protein